MNQNPTVIRQFIDSIESYGSVDIRTEHLGTLLATFPVIGGGTGCIVIGVEEKIVRLVQRPRNWAAEHLVVATGEGA